MPSTKTKEKPKSDEAEEQDADSELVEVTFAGFTFVIPRDKADWSTEAYSWLSEGKFDVFVKHLLNDTKNGQWKALCALAPTRRDFSAFFVLLGEKIRTECVGD